MGLVAAALTSGVVAHAAASPAELAALVGKNAQGRLFIIVANVDAREKAGNALGGDQSGDIAVMINSFRRVKGQIDKRYRAIVGLWNQGKRLVGSGRSAHIEYIRQADINAAQSRQGTDDKALTVLEAKVIKAFNDAGLPVGAQELAAMPVISPPANWSY